MKQMTTKIRLTIHQRILSTDMNTLLTCFSPLSKEKDLILPNQKAEIDILQKKLVDAPKRIRTLEEKLISLKAELSDSSRRNERLSATLKEAREHIAALREEVEKLTLPPAAYGTFLGINEDDTVDVISAGRKMRVSIHPDIDRKLKNRR